MWRTRREQLGGKNDERLYWVFNVPWTGTEPVNDIQAVYLSFPLAESILGGSMNRDYHHGRYFLHLGKDK